MDLINGIIKSKGHSSTHFTHSVFIEFRFRLFNAHNFNIHQMASIFEFGSRWKTTKSLNLLSFFPLVSERASERKYQLININVPFIPVSNKHLIKIQKCVNNAEENYEFKIGKLFSLLIHYHKGPWHIVRTDLFNSPFKTMEFIEILSFEYLIKCTQEKPHFVHWLPTRTVWRLRFEIQSVRQWTNAKWENCFFIVHSEIFFGFVFHFSFHFISFLCFLLPLNYSHLNMNMSRAMDYYYNHLAFQMCLLIFFFSSWEMVVAMLDGPIHFHILNFEFRFHCCWKKKQ